MYETDDLRIASIKAVTPPMEICEELPITEAAAKNTYQARQAIKAILDGADKRLLVITGPCSIHDIQAATEYAARLKPIIKKYQHTLLIIMRVYFEKPRTTVGWKGFINDPDLDNSFHINKGIRLARQLLLDLNEMGVAAATEFLDIITPQYVTDLVSWGAIGARTTESQVHRELASGLSCPVGFKNGTDGRINIAVDAIRAAGNPHHFLSLRKEGNSAIYATTGNTDCHIILRGGRKPNYDGESIRIACEDLASAKLPARLMVDFSHANSEKNHKKQLVVGEHICEQLKQGEMRIFGVMLESHLHEGRQDVAPGRALNYGQSITDPCLGWEDTLGLIDSLAQASQRRQGL